MSAPRVPFVRTPDANFADLAEHPFEPHYLDAAGLRMHFVDEGPRDAPVALMIHGMPTWSYLYRHVIPSMCAAGYRCVAPDHIGFGRSDKVTDPGWYDIARHTRNLTTLIEASTCATSRSSCRTGADQPGSPRWSRCRTGSRAS